MLHTINKSPFRSNSLEMATRFIQPGEPILFFEDGVYAAQENTKVSESVKSLMKNNPVYALQADIKARAVTKIIDGIKVVDYTGFVTLVEENKVQNWL